MPTLAERIDEIMKFKGWSQAELARQIEVERNTVNLWINGPTQKIEYETAFRLHHKSGFSLHWIMTGDGIKRDSKPLAPSNSSKTLDGEMVDWDLFETSFYALENYFSSRKLNPSPEEKMRAYRLGYLILRGEPRRDAAAVTRMLRLVVG